MSASNSFNRLVRFVPKSDLMRILIGQPLDDGVDVGLALRRGDAVDVEVFSGSSVLSPGVVTGRTETIHRLLSPLAQPEVGTIRCLGLNYRQHAAQVKADIPTAPTIFMKPSTAIGDPWPTPTYLPRLSQVDDCADYESELAVVVGRTAKNIGEDDVMDYVLGYTACNDISSRVPQLAQSQWCFSKGFDGACPLGPTLVSTSLVPDPSKLHVRGIKNGRVLQDCGVNDLIFNVPELVSYLSQSTTLHPGTVILTGTPAGIGFTQRPKETLRHGDEFGVEILPHIGTLVNVFEDEA